MPEKASTCSSASAAGAAGAVKVASAPVDRGLVSAIGTITTTTSESNSNFWRETVIEIWNLVWHQIELNSLVPTRKCKINVFIASCLNFIDLKGRIADTQSLSQCQLSFASHVRFDPNVTRFVESSPLWQSFKIFWQFVNLGKFCTYFGQFLILLYNFSLL